MSTEQVSTTTKRYQMLDVWRGIVSLVVVLEHTSVVLWTEVEKAGGVDGFLRRTVVGVLGLNLGSPLFFVMSGYCIAACLISARRKGDTPLEFLFRRLWRIFPAYWAAFALFFVLVVGSDAVGLSRLHRSGFSLEIGSPWELTGWQWFGNLTLTEMWRPLVTGGYVSVFTRVAWSLCYQEQFYVICVLALWLFPKRLDRSLGLATVCILAFRVATWDAGSLHVIDGSFPVYWHVFAVGLAVFWRLNMVGPNPTGLAKYGVEAGLCVFVVIGLIHSEPMTWASAAFGLVLVVTHRWDTFLGGIDWLAPLRACGKRSYSIYLTHLPVTAVGNTLLSDLGIAGYWTRLFVTMPLVVLASLGFAWVFHHLVECHFIGQPAWLSRMARKPPLAISGPIAVRTA